MSYDTVHLVVGQLSPYKTRLYHLRHPSNTLLTLVTNIVHIGTDFPALQHILVRRAQQRLEPVAILAVRVQPCPPIAALEDDRHPVVYGRHQAVRFGGNDSEGVYGLSAIGPLLPQTGKNNRVLA